MYKLWYHYHRSLSCSRPSLTPYLALDRVPGDAADHAGRRQLGARLDRLDGSLSATPEGTVRSHSQRTLQSDHRDAFGTLLERETAVTHQRVVALLEPVPHQAIGHAVGRNALQPLEGHQRGPGPGPEVTVGPDLERALKGDDGRSL